MFAGSKVAPGFNSGLVKSIRILFVAGALAAIVGLMPDIASRAQRQKDGPANVASVSSRTTANGSVVTIAADTSLNRAQTWQDSEGYHVTLPYNGPGQVKGSPGVNVRQVGRSLEVVVQVKPGARVTLLPQPGRLTLQVDGKLASQGSEGENETGAGTGRERVNPAADRGAGSSRTPAEASRAGDSGNSSQNGTAAQPTGENEGAPREGSAQDGATAQAPSGNVPPASKSGAAVDDSSTSPTTLASLLFSLPGVLSVVAICLIGFLVIRRRNSGWSDEPDVSEDLPLEVPTPSSQNEQVVNRKNDSRHSIEQSLGLVPTDPAGEVAPHGPPSHVAGSLFGAYRVDQEIGKLVLGQAHRMDVLASRAPDDRRAMEVALIKALTSPNTEEEGRRRARQALEEYGFVARQSATLLAAHDICERASAARTLGEIGAASSLPFLLEALYDNEPIVRNQCVSSLASLKLPSAIGALLDVARRHPSIPDSLLSHALSACSVESFGFVDVPPVPALLTGQDPLFTGEITALESTGMVDDLPDFVEDAELIEALGQLESPETSLRAAAVRQLAQFPVQRSVQALASVAIQDPEPAVRGSAVSCLGSIDHESVFAPVLIALADESREVRAAAARSLTGLSFDRADAYVRVIETANAGTLQHVAQACIKAGIVSQAMDRLASNDRRQAYEAFSLLSLLAKANEMKPILEAIEHHRDNDVRLCAVRVLGLSGQPEVAQELRQLAGRDDIPDVVRTSILEVIYKIDQAQAAANSAK
jgi:HEAT repeat protein